MSDEQKPSQKKRTKTELKHPLPDNRVSLDSHFDIISAYVVASSNGKNPVGYKELESFIKINSTLVSGCNKFFKHLGLIEVVEKTGKYKPTVLAEELHKARQWNDDNLKKSTLEKIIKNSWFWTQTHQYLQINKTASRDELIQKLGLACAADPKKHHNAIDKLIEYMQNAELIKENEGKFILNSERQDPQNNQTNSNTYEEQTQNSPEPLKNKTQTIYKNETQFGINFGIIINPETNEEQIRKAVRTMVDELYKIQKEKEEDSK